MFPRWWSARRKKLERLPGRPARLHVESLESRVLLAAPEIAVLDGTTELVDGDVVVIDFGTVVRGATAPFRTFTIRNDGDATLTLGRLTVPTGFSIAEGLYDRVFERGVDTFTVRLDSRIVGTKTGQVRFNNNDADEGPFTISITGTVLPPGPEIAVLDGTTALTAGVQTVVDFGDASLGQSGPTRTFTVRNDGNQTLSLGTPTLPTGFTLVEGLNSTLAAGGTDTFTVVLETSAVGVATGELSIATNDADERVFNFTVTGNVLGAGPEIQVVLGISELVDGTTTTTSFGSVLQGQNGPTLVFGVFNAGSDPLTIGAITVPTGFTLVDGLAASLAAGAADTFSVRLDTATAGTVSGEISIDNGDGDENPFNFPVTGTVRAAGPDISVLFGATAIVDGATSAIDLGAGARGQVGAKQTITVRNDGADTLTITGVALPAGLRLFERLNATLAAGASDSFTIQIDTAFAGVKLGEVQITSDDDDEAMFNFAVTATVTAFAAPEVTVLDGTTTLAGGGGVVIDFGNVVRRQAGPTRAFTVRNDGSDTLNIGRIELPVGFSLVQSPRRRLAPRGTDILVIRLDSRNVGARAGDIVIHTNDADEPVFRISVIGNVVA